MVGDEGVLEVELLGPLRAEAGGSPSLRLRVRGRAKLLEVLEMLPPRVRERVLRDGGVAPGILILVNGVEVTVLGGVEEVSVEERDRVTLIPIIHGG